MTPDGDAGGTSVEEHRLFGQARLGPIALRNRVVKSATYESMAERGLVTDQLIEWHREFAAGGVGMTTLAYCSASSEGRTFGDQIWMRDEAVPGLRRFTEAMHDEGAMAAVQLGHAGWFSDPRATGTKPVGPSRMFSPHALTWSRAFGDDDFERVAGDFASGARVAVEAGFDAIEVHVGHGYLLSQFLSPYNNRREDGWGGSVENRARFPRRVIEAVRTAAGPGVAVFAKLNMDDGFRAGLGLDDGVEVARLLEADGHLDAFQLTGGHTTKTPMYLMRGEVPLREMVDAEPGWVRRTGMRLMGKRLIREYPFEEAFFLPKARRFRTDLHTPLMLLGGITTLATMTAAVDEGFDFVAIGRALIREPDLIARMESGETDAGACIPCNQCTAKVGVEPTRCVFRTDP